MKTIKSFDDLKKLAKGDIVMARSGRGGVFPLREITREMLYFRTENFDYEKTAWDCFLEYSESARKITEWKSYRIHSKVVDGVIHFHWAWGIPQDYCEGQEGFEERRKLFEGKGLIEKVSRQPVQEVSMVPISPKTESTIPRFDLSNIIPESARIVMYPKDLDNSSRGSFYLF